MTSERSGEGTGGSGRDREVSHGGAGTLEGAHFADSDSVLALGLRQQSPHALAEAYRRHGRAVVGFIRSRTGNDPAADDIAQDVFIALWRDPVRFQPERGSLRSYLLTLASRRSIDAFRSEEARRRRQDSFQAAVQVGPSLEDSVVASDETAFVRRSLDILPAEERTAIDLAYFGHHNYREVARMLGKPEGTIKSRIRSGLQRLRSSADFARVLAS